MMGMRTRARGRYDHRMLSRHSWITAFVGRVLREGHCVDPDRAFDAAGDVYLDSRTFDPELVADSTFGASDTQSAAAPQKIR
jgi:hypothetical protein